MEPGLGGSASKTRYLFLGTHAAYDCPSAGRKEGVTSVLGDYVDRGVFGIEVSRRYSTFCV